MPEHINLKYLRPMADRALHEWFGDTYATMRVPCRAALAQDVAEIMFEEECNAIPAVMLLDLRIYPASITTYVQSLL